MKTPIHTHQTKTLVRISQWLTFAVALCSMLALVAVMTGQFDGKLVKLAPSANEAWQQYTVNNADISAIFQCR